MLEFLKRLTGRVAKVPVEEPSSEQPSWRPDRPPQPPEPEGPKPLSTLRPDSTPSLKTAGLTDNDLKKSAE
jgi:hypothetical protein